LGDIARVPMQKVSAKNFRNVTQMLNTAKIPNIAYARLKLMFITQFRVKG
jgi:hypothetical protein